MARGSHLRIVWRIPYVVIVISPPTSEIVCSYLTRFGGDNWGVSMVSIRGKDSFKSASERHSGSKDGASGTLGCRLLTFLCAFSV